MHVLHPVSLTECWGKSWSGEGRALPLTPQANCYCFKFLSSATPVPQRQRVFDQEKFQSYSYTPPLGVNPIPVSRPWSRRFPSVTSLSALLFPLCSLPFSTSCSPLLLSSMFSFLNSVKTRKVGLDSFLTTNKTWKIGNLPSAKLQGELFLEKDAGTSCSIANFLRHDSIRCSEQIKMTQGKKTCAQSNSIKRFSRWALTSSFFSTATSLLTPSVTF